MSLLNARFQQNRRKSKANAEYWADYEGHETGGGSSGDGIINNGINSNNNGHDINSGVDALNIESGDQQEDSVDVEEARGVKKEATQPQQSSGTSTRHGASPDPLGQDIANVLDGVTVVKLASPYSTSPDLVQTWDSGFTANNSSAMALHGHGNGPLKSPMPPPPPLQESATTRTNKHSSQPSGGTDVELVALSSGSPAAPDSASSSSSPSSSSSAAVPANDNASVAMPHPHSDPNSNSSNSAKPSKLRGLLRQASSSTALRGNRRSKDGLSRDSGDLADLVEDQSPEGRARAALVGFLEAANVPSERADSLAAAGLSSVESLLELDALPASQVVIRRIAQTPSFF